MQGIKEKKSQISVRPHLTPRTRGWLTVPRLLWWWWWWWCQSVSGRLAPQVTDGQKSRQTAEEREEEEEERLGVAFLT